jgi:E3 ubiquitin-protein ligase ZNF598
MVEEHAAEMSSRDKKDARRVNAAFEFQDASGPNRRRGGVPDSGGSGSGGGRERGQRDSQPQIAPRPTLGSDNRHSLFGAHLTIERDANNSSPEPSRQQGATPPPPSTDPSAEYASFYLHPCAVGANFFLSSRYAAVFARLRTLTAHTTNAAAGVKLALRDYTASQSAARDLISTVWNTLDCELDATASIINLVVDSLEEEEKKTDLLSAWNSFKIERRRELSPDIIVLPTSAGTDYARVANGRIVSAASAHRAAPPRQTQRAVWDRVAQAAERGATYPHLRVQHQQQQQQQPSRHSPQPPTTGPTPGVRQRGARKTAWSASIASVGTGGGGNSSGSNNSNTVSTTSQSGKPPPAPPPPAPALTNAAFPTLPSSVAPRAPPVVSARTGQLQHILSSTPPATSAWAPGRPAQDEALGMGEMEEVAVPAEAGAGGRKKGKGRQKQKQTLLVIGSYPMAGTGRQD